MLTSGVYFCVLIFLATKAVQVQTFCCPSKCYYPCFADGVNFIYYDCDGNNKTFPISKPQALMTVLNTKKRTILYIPGFSQTPKTDSVQGLIKGLCCNKDDNIVLLDWSKYSVQVKSYPDTAQNAEKLGKFLASIIHSLENAGFNICSLRIIGVSLGAHIAGIAGKCTKILYSKILTRITGLDPANPAYEKDMPICHLEKYDATCVDVIHTDMGGSGTTEKCGTADYYPNGGKRLQPGCSPAEPLSDADFCSHRFAVKLYAMTKCQPYKFNATQCCSYDSYKAGNCSGNLNTTVGYAACCDVRGDFYFNTTEL